jgi:hypothetical protein
LFLHEIPNILQTGGLTASVTCWWAGVDAVSAITVCLIWPSEIFILAFLATHLIMVLGLGLISAIREKKISLHRLPGIPILLASVIFLKIRLVFLN